MSEQGAYLPIEDYAFIGDCQAAALISSHGSIDWCCMPRFDAASIFGRLLDWDRGGYCQISPSEPAGGTARVYLEDTLVLATTFEARTGGATLYDFFAIRADGSDRHRHLVRIVEGERGTVEFTARISPRFDYAEVRPWVRHHGAHLYSAIGGNDSLLVDSEVELERVEMHDLEARFVLHAGTRVRFTLTWLPPEDIDVLPHGSNPSDIDRSFDDTIAWWRSWAEKMSVAGVQEPQLRRSALILKGLTYRPTGAVAAAATTSLPESMGGERNWDYRFSWIRDSQFTVRSLAEVGCDDEAAAFSRFVERSAAGGAESLQIMYGVGGERRLTEYQLTDLAGYRQSSPVRIGNRASGQIQLDVYGYLLDLSWRWHRRGRSPDDDYWRFLLSLVDAAVERWNQPDQGIWEVRGDPEHFVHSKVMCWVALDRGLRLAEACLRRAPQRRWTRTRETIREAVETEGYSQNTGGFRRAFGTEDVDSALMLIPAFDFVSYTDERMVRTTDLVRKDLDDGGFLRRYRSQDGLGGQEGVFIACSFWLVEVLAKQGRLDEAREVFDRTMATANDVGVFSEEYDPRQRTSLGNIPQGLSHLSHIAAAVALAKQSGPSTRVSPIA